MNKANYKAIFKDKDFQEELIRFLKHNLDISAESDRDNNIKVHCTLCGVTIVETEYPWENYGF